MVNSEALSKENKIALAKFAKKNNLSVPAVINRILASAIDKGALSQALSSPFEAPEKLRSIH